MKSFLSVIRHIQTLSILHVAFMVLRFNYRSLINPNWKPKFPLPCFSSVLWTEFQVKCDFHTELLNSWPDILVDCLCCSVTGTWYWIFFLPFANPLLSEAWWQHHNFSINCRSSKFPHDWKSCATTRNCLPFVIRQREWKLVCQEETFHVFSNVRGIRGPCIMQSEVLRVFGQPRCTHRSCTLQKDAKMFPFLWGRQCRGQTFTAARQTSPSKAIMRSSFLHEAVFYYLALGCLNFRLFLILWLITFWAATRWFTFYSIAVNGNCSENIF